MFCGERVYTLVAPVFMTLFVPTDPWNFPEELQLFTDNPLDVGVYSGTLTVALFDYPEVPPMVLTFLISIIQLQNKLPYFSPALAASAEIQMTHDPQSWSFPLPPIVDEDFEAVTVTVNFGTAGSFMYLNGQSSLEVDDISIVAASLCIPGFHLITINLNDGRDIVMVPFSVFVLDAPPLEVVADPTATTTDGTLDPTATDGTSGLTTTGIDGGTTTDIIVDPADLPITEEQIEAVMDDLINEIEAGLLDGGFGDLFDLGTSDGVSGDGTTDGLGGGTATKATLSAEDKQLLKDTLKLAQSLGMSLNDIMSTTSGSKHSGKKGSKNGG